MTHCQEQSPPHCDSDCGCCDDCGREQSFCQLCLSAAIVSVCRLSTRLMVSQRLLKRLLSEQLRKVQLLLRSSRQQAPIRQQLVARLTRHRRVFCCDCDCESARICCACAVAFCPCAPIASRLLQPLMLLKLCRAPVDARWPRAQSTEYARCEIASPGQKPSHERISHAAIESRRTPRRRIEFGIRRFL